MKISKYLPIVILICIGLVFATADAQENFAQEAYAVFEQNCLNCHGASGSFKEALLIDRTALVDTGVVIPGDPENSEFYKRLLGPTENGPQMPLNLPPLSQEAVETIASWITIGAPDWDVQYDINFITTAAMLDTMRTHLESLDPFDRPSARYFTMTHLHNAGESPETLNDYRIALSKLINSLSWKFEITNPTPIDTAQTIFHIDLRRYEWNTTTDVWTHIEQAYPYNIAFDPETQADLLDKLTHLQTETGSTIPFVYMDWFLSTASLPPLYHDILGLPQTDRLLETQLDVDVASNIRNAPGINVWRAGFNDSGVSTNNRVVERHTSRYGAYWKSYDFAGSVGSQNIFTHPLDFTHDGGEIIFNLPNGLQAYFLVDANGNRLNDAPIDIVSNPAASDPTVRNGLSCIGCHTQGMKKFEDSVRAAIEQDENPPYNKEQALRLYPEQSVLDELLEKDTLRFQQALEKIGGPFADDASRQQFFKRHENEPVQRFHEAFQAPLDASHAAAAVGLETEVFLTQIREKQSLKNLGLQTLTDVNGTVKRDAWTSNFDDVISALNTPDSVLPPVVERPERIPGAGVYIPDANLRAVIEEALGKAAGDVIAVEDMETLTDLDAENKGIRDLTGLEFATHMQRLVLGFEFATNSERIELNGNQISDISPLAGLINLERLELNGNQISDISPLAGLINLERLELRQNQISDISPLAGLINLLKLNIRRNPLSDISPLASAIKLEFVEVSDTLVSDISPLSALKNLNKFSSWNSPISDISPLTHLTIIDMCGAPISDLSPLAAAKNLRELYLLKCNISDVSPLTELAGLTRLNLEGNNISDVSPLAALTELEWLKLTDNPITDFSPLEALSENTNILTGEVAIPDRNLRAAIAEALGKASGATITAWEMVTLEKISASGMEIEDLTGLEYATHLEVLKINGNPISDLSPLAGLRTLKELNISWTKLSNLSPLTELINLQHLEAWSEDNSVSDLSPLANLTNLTHLDMSGSRGITDISPLARLTNLTYLRLYDNAVTDISPLTGLIHLEVLFVEANHTVLNLAPLTNLKRLRFLHLAHNKISDISVLSGLIALKMLYLHYNQIVDVSPLASLQNLKRLQLHHNNISDVSPLDRVRKNLEQFTWFGNPGFPEGGRKIEGPWLWLMLPIKVDEAGLVIDYLAEASDSEVTEQQIATLGATEGHVIGNNVWSLVRLAPYNQNEPVSNRDNLKKILRPQEDASEFVVYGSITLHSPSIQRTRMFVGASRGRKVWLNGELVYEDHIRIGGVYNYDYQDFSAVTLKKGKNVLLVGCEYTKDPWGFFFGFEPGTEYKVFNPSVGYTFSDSKIHVGDTFTLDLSAEDVIDLAGWQFDVAFDPTRLEAVEVNEGDFLKTDGGTTFFQEGTIDNTTGKITGLNATRFNEDGATGTGTLLSVVFLAKTEGETQLTLNNFQLGSTTGEPIAAAPPEIVITIEEQLATGDVNRDGQVNVLDMILVSRHFGEAASANPQADVNRDGTINIQDLILVAQHLGESTIAAAPSIIAAINNGELTPAIVQAWIAQAQVQDDGSIAFRQGIVNLERLLALFIPEETALLANYPNPFNPETWIPYQLAEPASVTLRIYTVNGELVRTLALGQTPAGIYQTRSRAAYWDGKNEVGEPVASAVYFYTLTAGDFNATRKMLIRK